MGKGFKFDFEKTTKSLLKNHDLLYAPGERQVELSSSIDEATLIRSLGLVVAVVELIDTGYEDHVSKEHVKLTTMYSCLVQIK